MIALKQKCHPLGFALKAGFAVGSTNKAFGLYWDDQFTAKIKFPASQARYIKERKWAEQQQIDDLPDGSIILTMETSGSYDVKRWVMSFGSDAELLEPKDLRKEIHQEIKSMAKAYSLLA